jgi:hypothetical protein
VQQNASFRAATSIAFIMKDNVHERALMNMCLQFLTQLGELVKQFEHQCRENQHVGIAAVSVVNRVTLELSTLRKQLQEKDIDAHGVVLQRNDCVALLARLNRNDSVFFDLIQKAHAAPPKIKRRITIIVNEASRSDSGKE